MGGDRAVWVYGIGIGGGGIYYVTQWVGAHHLDSNEMRIAYDLFLLLCLVLNEFPKQVDYVS